MMTFQHNKKKEQRQPFNINGRLFFANLVTTFKNLFEADGRCITGRFCICSLRGQSAMEYFAIIFSVLILAAIGAHEFFNQAKVSGNLIYEKSLNRIAITGLYVGPALNAKYIEGYYFDDESGVPASEYASWYADSRGTVSCVNIFKWLPGTSFTLTSGSQQVRYMITPPGLEPREIILTVTGDPSCVSN